MKKLLLFLMILLSVASVCQKDLYSFNGYFNGDYTSYSSTGNGIPIYSVNGKAVYCHDKQQANNIGETIIINGGFTIDDILHKIGAIYHFNSNIDNIKIVYGYSPLLKHIKIVDNKPVNFQVTEVDGIITLSNPINFGSY